ncbi:NAD(P)/FAD-dependent oxidoreductase [Sphingomonas sp. MMS24-J13]|uniref:NAD(P)/FAD-dependent oxidoreductase n=1 Tax=Sphingomonas sp. MMS24-J13 TaxID=3238686 RepID=UPI003851481F
MSNSSSFDAVIIGAGVIGCSIALALTRKGYRTLNIDKLPAAGYGSTSSSAAIIRPYYSTVEGTALAYEGHFYWQEWADFLGLDPAERLTQYIQCGCLVLMSAGEDRLAATQRTLGAVGVPFDVIEPEELRRRAPTIDLQSFAPPKRIDDPEFGLPNGGTLGGAIFCPTGGYINDPQLACHNLAQASIARGATYRFNREVVEILRVDGRVTGLVLDDRERIEAPVVINAAGPHSSKINAMAGVAADMTIATGAMRQEVVHVPAPAGFAFGARGSVMTDGDSGVYMRPETGNHMLIGSLEPACDTLEWADPDTFVPELTEQSTNQLWRAAQRFPTLGIPNQAQGLAALYDVSSDWIPIYDRSDLDGYFMAIGTSGNQFKNAPVVGEMMAELVEYCAKGGDHDAEPLTFHLRHIDRDLSLSFFSRKRPVHAESSFSVLG